MNCRCLGRCLSGLASRGRTRGGAGGLAGAAASAARGVVRAVLTGDPVEHRMTLVLRTDLQMGKGKLCAQASHGALSAYRAALASGDPARAAWLAAWEGAGQGKVVVRADSEAQLLALREACLARGLPCTVTRDAGLTQVACGSVTCLAIGPAPAALIDEVTGDLRLL